MEVIFFKKKSEFDNFVLSRNEGNFYKLLHSEKGIFRTSYKVLSFDEKDILNFAINHFYQIIEILGIKDFKEKAKIVQNKIIIAFITEVQEKFLLKNHGYILSSIQNLISNYIFVSFSKWFQIEINVNNHLGQQKNKLKKQVYQTVKQIKLNKKTYHFQPMPNNQRRIIHEIVKDIDNITSHSEGKGYKRHVVLSWND